MTDDRRPHGLLFEWTTSVLARLIRLGVFAFVMYHVIVAAVRHAIANP